MRYLTKILAFLCRRSERKSRERLAWEALREADVQTREFWADRRFGMALVSEVGG